MTTVLAVIVDTSVVAGLALLVCMAFRRRPAALRPTVLAASLAAAAVAPALEIALPHWEFPVLSSAAPVAAPAPVLTSDVTTTSTVAMSAVPAAPRRSWVPVLVTIWATGFLVVMLGLLAGLVRLVRMTRACRPVRAASVWKERAEALSAQSALTRPVVVLESHERAPLLTWGVLRPRIVVPAHAQSWARDCIEIVLAHELAHIVRRDWVLQIGAEVLRAVYWFNPLIWMVCRRLRYEAEQACDDAVLRRGVDAADYAAHLLAVARHVQANGRAWASAPAVASPSTLERRIAVILHGQRIARRRAEPLELSRRLPSLRPWFR